MNRNIRIERVYKISDYNTLRIGDDIEDIPVNDINQDLFNEVAYMQLVSIELVSVRYAQLTRKVNKYKDIDELIAFLTEEKEKSLESVKLLLQSKFETTKEN